ncbi:ArnT family glycosyltransferase [Thermoproteota archaeon]
MKKSRPYNTFSLEASLIFIMLLLSLLARAYIYTNHNPSWDPAAYILMGKYMFSLGNVGLWEPLRPIIWSAMLGFSWFLGGDPIYWGHILQILFSLGSIYLVYLISRLVFDKKVGVLAAFFLSFSPIYFFWGNYLFTRLPSTFFGLLSLYLLLKSKHLSSGIMSGIAFLTNYTQFLLFVSLSLINSFQLGKKEKFRETIKYMFGFVLVFTIFLISNSFMYHNPLFPITLSFKTLRAYSPLWYQGPFYYLTLLATQEGFYLLFCLVGIFFVVRKDRDAKKLLILLISIIFFAFTVTLREQNSRYLITLLPYLSLLSAYGIMKSYDFLKKKSHLISMVISIIFISLLISFKYSQLKSINIPKKEFDVFQEYIERNKNKITGDIWISNPMMVVYSDLKPSQLIYFPVFDSKKAKELQSKLNTASLIMFNSYDFPCSPIGDNACEEEKARLIKKIGSEFKPVINAVDQTGKTVGGIFTSQTPP